MGLSEMLEKSNPVQAKRQKENISAFKSLTNRNVELIDENKWLKQDNERLNNIINELEKKLLELRLTDIDGKTIVYRLLDKLQELKGSDKE